MMIIQSSINSWKRIVRGMLTIKKLLVLIFALMMILPLVACGTTNSDANSTQQEQQSATSVKNTTETVSEGQTQPHSTTKKILVAYFSRVGSSSFSEDVDVVSSASLRVEDTRLIGNT